MELRTKAALDVFLTVSHQLTIYLLPN